MRAISSRAGAAHRGGGTAWVNVIATRLSGTPPRRQRSPCRARQWILATSDVISAAPRTPRLRLIPAGLDSRWRRLGEERALERLFPVVLCSGGVNAAQSFGKVLQYFFTE